MNEDLFIFRDLESIMSTPDDTTTYRSLEEVNNDITHSGRPHQGSIPHSGRYPWGSGDEDHIYKRNLDLYSRMKELEQMGVSQKAIAEELGFRNATHLRGAKEKIVGELERYRIHRCQQLKEKGYSNDAIAKALDLSGESVVRNYLKKSNIPGKAEAQEKIRDFLKQQVDEYGMIDVGKGNELFLNCSPDQRKYALELLKDEGYNVYTYKQKQAGTGKETTMLVLTDENVSWGDMIKNRNNIHTITNTTIADNGYEDPMQVHPPKQIDSKRVYIRYKEDGGVDRDGTIELRRGVKDLDLGENTYAQVRIAVQLKDKSKNDGKYFLKGMAFYKDDIPEGYDIVYNTNKKRGTEEQSVFKPQILDDPLNPFGSNIKPGGQKGALNLLREEGDVDKWSTNLPSQFLSKQPVELARQQLKLTVEYQEAKLKEINSINNPTLKKKMLLDFADECDTKAVELKALGLPRTATKNILPVPSLSDTEVYAPGYKDGERVALIRFPHGGKFEIPELIVNNKNREAKGYIKDAIDAVGINPRVAERLSGADFDGDTVLIIPNNDKKIKSEKPLKQLENFDTKMYKVPDGMEPLKKGWKKGSRQEQDQMGMATNLVTDMHLKGADNDELARAVKYTMVVIDTGKHNLDWYQCYQDMNIKQLKDKYQGHTNKSGRYSTGANTIISRAGSKVEVPVRNDAYEIDSKTGEKIFTYGGFKKSKEVIPEYKNIYEKDSSGKFVKDENGNLIVKKVVQKTQGSTQMYETKDAYTLVGDKHNKMETLYADYANSMKALANKTRLDYLSVKEPPRDNEAKKKYKAEVDSLKAKLEVSKSNAPLERQAQRVAEKLARDRIEAKGGDLSEAEKSKILRRMITPARKMVGAKAKKIYITDKEWEAINNNAVGKTALEEILAKTDETRLYELALPKTDSGLSSSQEALVRSYYSRGYTRSDIMETLGISEYAVKQALS